MYIRIVDIAQELGVSQVDVERAVDALGVRDKLVYPFLHPREAQLVRNYIGSQLGNRQGQSSNISSAIFAPMYSSQSFRVHEVAKANGLTSKELLAACRAAGVMVGSHLSHISPAEIDRALETLGNGVRNQSESRPSSSPAPKRWPQIGQYVDALANATLDFSSSSLKSMHVFMPDGTPGSAIRTSGAFACVAKVQINGRNYALRLLIRSQPDLEERYREIVVLNQDGVLGENLADVNFLPEEVSVQFDDGAEKFPVILVEWVDGVLLSRFVEAKYSQGDDASLKSVHQQILRLRSRLQKAGVSHGDLSGDNIMIVGDGHSLSLKLLDYDSMWFSKIAGLTCAVGESGNLQHPLRPNPIGPFADEVAFRMYDLVLRFLIDNDGQCDISGLFDQRILLTREEWISCISPLAKQIFEFDPGSYSVIGSLLTGSYDAVEKAAMMPLGPGAKEFESGDPRVEPEHVSGFSFDELCSEFELSVGAVRHLLVEAGIGATDVSGLYSAEQMKTLRELAIRNGLLNQRFIEKFQVSKESIDEAESKQELDGQVAISEVARRCGLSVGFTAIVSQDVLARAVGSDGWLTPDELGQVLSRVREDRRYPYELGKVCRKAAISEKSAIEKVTQSLPQGILRRQYGVRISVEARDILLPKPELKRPAHPPRRPVVSPPSGHVGSARIVDSASIASIAASTSVSISEVELLARKTLGRWVTADEILSSDQAATLKFLVEDVVRRFPTDVSNLARELGTTGFEIVRAINSFGFLWRMFNFRENSVYGRLSFVGANEVRKRMDEFRIFETSLEDLASEYGVNLQEAVISLQSRPPIWLAAHTLRIGGKWYVDEEAKLDVLDTFSAPRGSLNGRLGQRPESRQFRWRRWKKP
mgnify:CR=1 FL=1